MAKQIEMLRKENKAYGGELMKRRKGRVGGRPLDTRNSMHMVLRSSKAKGTWSFKRPKNEKAIKILVEKFAHRYGVRVLTLANVGNHLHFHIRLSNRYTYRPFIRGLTAAIMMAVTGYSRWKKRPAGEKFWDYRPFTRVIANGLKSLLTIKDYLRINQLEGFGYEREVARIILWGERARAGP